MELFKILGKIAIDNSEANKGLEETSSKAATVFNKIGSGAAKVGKAVATGIAAGTVALGGLTVSALNAAGELEQNMGGSEAVFAHWAKKVQQTSEEAFKNMGLSASDYLATANKMGALFQGAGFTIEQSMRLSSDAMQRAADVASIMGIDTSAAMEAVAGAAKGNFTMMDNLGVAMNDTTLQAYALSKGIKKTTSEMSNQEKIALAMELFMEKTAYSAGNYAKENETLAGSLGTAKAALSNFLAGVGSADEVATALANTAGVIVNNINALFPALVDGLTSLVQQTVPMIPPLIEKLLPSLIEGSVGLINGIVASMPQIVSALLAAVPALIDGVMQVVNVLIGASPQFVQMIVEALPSLLPQLIEGLVAMMVMMCTMLPDIIQPIIDYLPEILITITDVLIENLPILIDGWIAMVSGLVKALPQILSGLWYAIKDAFYKLAPYLEEWFKPVVEWFSDTWESFVEIVTGVWDSICNVVTIAFKLIASIFDAAFQIITLPFQFIWENCKEYVYAAFEWIKEKIDKAVEWIKEVIQVGFTFVKDKIINPINEAKAKATEIFDKIRSQIQEKVTAVKNKVSEVFDGIKTKISGVVDDIKSKVTERFDAVKKAMEEPMQKARDTIKGIIDKISGFFSEMKLEFPDIKLPHFGISPSGWKIGDLLQGSIPKLTIDWYAKAMNNPMVMTEPTIFGYNSATGTLMGGGEAGTEVLAGANTLMGMIKGAVAGQNNALAPILYRILEAIIAMDENMGGNMREALAGTSFEVNNREFARLVRAVR